MVRIGDVLRSRRWLLTGSLLLNGLLAAGLLRHRVRDLAKRWFAPQGTPSVVDWNKRPAAEKFRENRSQPGSTVFFGDSITAEAQWGELFAGLLNRGVPGDTSRDLLARLDEVTARRPARLFMMIGVNDLFRGASADEVIDSVNTLLVRLREQSPETSVTLISMLPIRNGAVRGIDNQRIRAVNERFGQLAQVQNVRFVDAFPKFLDHNGELRAELTYDGVHLRPAGYWLLRDTLGEW